MASSLFSPTRRRLLAGIGAVAVSGRAIAVRAQSRGPQNLVLQAAPEPLSLGPGRPETIVWSLRANGASIAPRFRQGDEVDLILQNDLPAPLILNWHGPDGLPSIEPLIVRRPVSPGKTERYVLPLRQAGTFLCDAHLLGDGLVQSLPAQALIVEEQTPAAVDRDETVLIEDWRLDADGLPIAPGTNAKAGSPLYRVNRQPALDLTLRVNDRIRLRFINACQRNAIALGIQNLGAWIMAIDSQPAEPFLARNGQFVLAPGTRVDVFADAVAPAGTTSAVTLHDGGTPREIARLHISAEKSARTTPLPAPAALPAGDLPARLDMKAALRVELPLAATGAAPAAWVSPALFRPSAAPAFQVKRGRTVVLTLTNPSTTPMVFHLHGHHVRLLDRLDDGWKPFWLDTVLVDAGQTQRIAFAADFAGAWLMEATPVDWGAPRGLRWFAVE